MNKHANVERLQNHKLTCSVVGARGYAGIETARLLLQHPHVELKYCFATSEFQLSNFLNSPEAAQVECLLDSEILTHLTDVVFLATPAEVSMELAPKILEAGKKVIDLSGAFRLKKNDFMKWYGFEFKPNKYSGQAAYGLSPWLDAGNGGPLIANPGCYATAILMALIPLLKNNVISEKHIVIDAKSGTTGSGKKPIESSLFSEVDGECLPYKVGRHQHYPEIVEAVESFGGKKIDAHMTTSLLPVRRGIIAGVYAQLTEGKTLVDVESAFQSSYQNYPLLSFGELQKSPGLLSLKKVVGTAKTHISFDLTERKLYLFSCIDNLLKGAASQAIENLNLISGLPVSTGLSHLEVLT